MIVVSDRPKARFPPTWSRCQCVLNRVVTWPPPGSLRSCASTASVDAATPPSTSTWPVLPVRTRTLPPTPVSITKPSLTGTTAGLSWEKAKRAKGGRVRPKTPPNAPFTIVLRFMTALRFMAGCSERSDSGDLAGAVRETLHLQPRLVEQREVQIANRRAHGQIDMASALERAGAAAEQDVRQRIIAVHVAVAHVGAVEQHGVIQQRAFAIGGGGEFRDELREPLHVIALNLDQLFKPIDIIGMM